MCNAARLLVHCHNQAVVEIWQSGKSKDAALMCLVRTLFFTAAMHNNFTLILQHIQEVDNSIADALSRPQFHRFRSLAPEADDEPPHPPLLYRYPLDPRTCIPTEPGCSNLHTPHMHSWHQTLQEILQSLRH